jgi:hypothetical protein
MVEDGYALRSTQATWNRIHAAVAAGKGFDVPIYDETSMKKVKFCLRWRREVMMREPLAWRNMVEQG